MLFKLKAAILKIYCFNSFVKITDSLLFNYEVLKYHSKFKMFTKITKFQLKTAKKQGPVIFWEEKTNI